LKKIRVTTTILLVITSVFLLTASLLSGCNKTTLKQLDIYIWDGYVPDKVADLFKQETGIKLNINLISENEKTLAFLKEGGKADIVMPTHSSLNKYYEAGLARAIDLKNIPNYEKISKPFMDQPWIKWDGKQQGSGEIYAIPYIFGTSGLVINTSKYTESLDDVGWEILFNTDLKEKVASRNTIISILLILNLLDKPCEDIITDKQGILDNVRDKAVALKDNVLKFYNTENEILDLMENEEIWVCQIQDKVGRKLSQSDTKFKYILPKTGGLAWADTFIIPKEAANPDGAYLFIDFMLRPDIASMITSESGFTTTVEGALDMAEGIDKGLYTFVIFHQHCTGFSQALYQPLFNI